MSLIPEQQQTLELERQQTNNQQRTPNRNIYEEILDFNPDPLETEIGTDLAGEDTSSGIFCCAKIKCIIL